MDKGADSWSRRTAFVGFDWASDHHDVVLVDAHGTIVEDFRFDDTAEGWELLRKKLSKHPDPAVAIETSSGATVERLLEAGYAVYPINPKAAKRYREACYQKKRKEGQTHACALRCLGQRWLKILWKMWKTKTPYDAEFHQRNQVKHGSWVIGLVSAPNA